MRVTRFVGIAFLILSMVNVSSGQEDVGNENYISKGQWLVGGQLLFSVFNDFENSFSVSPMGGYFIAEKMAVGLSTGYSNGELFSNVFYAQPFFRYYLTQKRLAPFGEAAVGAAWSKNDTDPIYRIGVGVDYFITKNVALEGILRYDFDLEGINLMAGLQFFIR